MNCPFCGIRYTEVDSKSACDSCPMGGSCGMLKCPNCGYEQPVPPKPGQEGGLIARLFKRKRPGIKAGQGTEQRLLSLADAEAGTRGIVARLKMHDRKTLRKLMTMGIMPGIAITVDQSSPAYVVTVGGSQIAMDRAMAGTVFLQC